MRFAAVQTPAAHATPYKSIKKQKVEDIPVDGIAAVNRTCGAIRGENVLCAVHENGESDACCAYLDTWVYLS
jgi:hypothetical protein